MKLSKEQIIKEALTLLDNNGVEGVTLRKLAERLDVEAPALYWHFENKAMLITEMAEAILKAKFNNLKLRTGNESWELWLIQTCQRLRRAMLSHTDGGRVVAGAHLSPTLSKVTEISIQSLISAGLSLRKSYLIVTVTIRYTFGQVIEEQTPVPAAGQKYFDHEEFIKDYPLFAAGIQEYFSSGHTAEDFFNDGLKILIGKYNLTA